MLPFSDACERNKEPILAKLRRHFANCSYALEIGSGTGQHAVHFAAHLPHLTWHPTEQLQNLTALEARVAEQGGPNLVAPSVLDVNQAVWPVERVDAVFSANTLHIMPWSAVGAMFAGIGARLAPGGTLCVYGPFLYEGQATASSNREFDRHLRERDPASGLRDIGAVIQLAATHGIHLHADDGLPANNRLLAFSREPD